MVKSLLDDQAGALGAVLDDRVGTLRGADGGGRERQPGDQGRPERNGVVWHGGKLIGSRPEYSP